MFYFKNKICWNTCLEILFLLLFWGNRVEVSPSSLSFTVLYNDPAVSDVEPKPELPFLDGAGKNGRLWLQLQL